jgi:transcriptional regulator with XRE-family HTH domain
MKFQDVLTDEAALRELGSRLTKRRLELNLTQADVAERAGIGKRTLERIEAGASTQLTNFLRLLRALDLQDRLDLLLPVAAPSPITLLELQGRERRRASAPRSVKVAEEPWTWDD